MYSVIDLISFLIRILQILFIARFIAQLIDMRGSNPITRFLMDITEPILAPVRRLCHRPVVSTSPRQSYFSGNCSTMPGCGIVWP
ncbi:MAG: YggT family protein [Thermomicrobiales bacterium]